MVTDLDQHPFLAGDRRDVDMRHAGGDRIMAQVLATVPTAGLAVVLVAVELVNESGALSAEHILNVLARLDSSPAPDTVETSLELKEAPRANTERYDSLREFDSLITSTQGDQS